MCVISRGTSVKFNTGKKSNVEQQHANDQNINTIMRKMRTQGILPSLKEGGQYGNFTNAQDFQIAQNKIIEAKNDFNRLPAELRKQFDNEPYNLLIYLEDPENREEAIQNGLLPPDPIKEPPKKITAQKAVETPEEQPEPKKASVVSA